MGGGRVCGVWTVFRGGGKMERPTCGCGNNNVFGDVWVGQWSSGALVFQLE